MASPVWDIVGNDGAGGDNGLSSVGLRHGDGGAFLVLERWRCEVFPVGAAPIQPSGVVCVLRCRCPNPTR